MTHETGRLTKMQKKLKLQTQRAIGKTRVSNVCRACLSLSLSKNGLELLLESRTLHQLSLAWRGQARCGFTQSSRVLSVSVVLVVIGRGIVAAALHSSTVAG